MKEVNYREDDWRDARPIFISNVNELIEKGILIPIEEIKLID
ncbi:hypothetical protein ACIT6Z_002388 [Listeria monocytogenes]|nr:hypothetical protein [Listeria monocytogenes]